MPLFEYICDECGHRFEAFVIGSRQPEGCPKCGSAHLEKQFSTFGMGGGWSGAGVSRGSSCGPTGGG